MERHTVAGVATPGEKKVDARSSGPWVVSTTAGFDTRKSPACAPWKKYQMEWKTEVRPAIFPSLFRPFDEFDIRRFPSN